MAELYRYAAFISYSSKDTAFARRLHRALESYGIPSSLGKFDIIGGGKKNRIYPIFRDREELSAGHLGDQIEANLKASAALIVVCSPNSAASPWVQKEIEFFAAQGRHGKVFAIIPDTAPLADATGADATQSCFPPAFRGDALSGDKLEPLAADARKGKDGFRSAWLKIVAGMIGVSPGQIIDRDKKRRAQQRLALGISLVVAVASIGVASAVVESYNFRSELTQRGASLAAQGRPLQGMPYVVAGLPASGDVIGVTHASADAAIDGVGARVRLQIDLGDPSDTRQVKFSSDGRFLAVHLAGEVILHDLRDPGASARLWREAYKWEFSPNARYFYIEYNNRREILDLETGRQIPVGPAEQFTSIVFAPGDRFVITQTMPATDNDALRAWIGTLHDLTDPRRDISLGRMHVDGSQRGGIFSPDGRFLLTLTPEFSATLRDLRGGVPISLGTLRVETDTRLTARFAFSPDGRFLATIDNSNHGFLRDLNSGHVRALGPIAPYVHFSSDSRLLIALDLTESILMYDLVAGTAPITVRPSGMLDETDTGIMLADRYFAVVGSNGGRILLDTWRSGASSPFGEHLRYNLSPRRGFLVTREGEMADGALFDVNNPSRSVRLEAPYQIGFSRDDRHLVTVTPTDLGTLWDTGRLREVANLGNVERFYFSGDDRFLITLGMNDQSALRNLQDGSVTPLGPVHDILVARRGSFFVTLSNYREGAVLRDAVVVASGRGRALRAEICRASADALRPFAAHARSGSDSDSGRLSGRPWNPCDWRGLLAVFPNESRGDGWLEGLRQWLRLMHVRYFGGRDYACEETPSAASAELRARRRDMCERFAETSPA